MRGFFLSIILSISIVQAQTRSEDEKQWFSANDSQVRFSHCMSLFPPPDNYLWAEIQRDYSASDLERAFDDLVPAMAGKLREKDRTKENYTTLLKTTFTDHSGYVTLIRLKYGFNARVFQKHELESTYLAMQAMPEGFRSSKENYELRRVKQIQNEKVIANVTLTFSDLWSYSTDGKRIYTFIHELGHMMEMSSPDTAAWRDISHFPAVIGSPRDHFKPDTVVSEYGQRNQYEDWAESVSSYRFNPNALLAASPEKYEWIRWQVFGGKEYLSQADCKSTSYFSAPENLQEADKYLDACRYTTMRRLFQETAPASDQAYADCMARKLWREKLKHAVPDQYRANTEKVASLFYERSIRGKITDSILANSEKAQGELAQEFVRACDKALNLNKTEGCSASKYTYLYFTDDPDLNHVDWRTDRNRLVSDLEQPINRRCQQICLERKLK